MRPTHFRSLSLVAVALLALSGCASKKDPTADGSTVGEGLGEFGPSSVAGDGFGVDGLASGAQPVVVGPGGAGDLYGAGTGIDGNALGGVGAGQGVSQGTTYADNGLIDGGVIAAAPQYADGTVYTDTSTYADPNASIGAGTFDQNGNYVEGGTYGQQAGVYADGGQTAGSGGFSTYGSDAGNALSGYSFPGDNGSPSYFAQQVGNRVLFETDSSQLTENSRETLRRQAAWLQLHPEHSALLEGHADERGTREYNIGLGARRADAVMSYMTSLGVARGRLRTVSYGKERPVSLGSGPGAWAQNRRVETALSNGANF